MAKLMQATIAAPRQLTLPSHDIEGELVSMSARHSE